MADHVGFDNGLHWVCDDTCGVVNCDGEGGTIKTNPLSEYLAWRDYGDQPVPDRCPTRMADAMAVALLNVHEWCDENRYHSSRYFCAAVNDVRKAIGYGDPMKVED